MRSAEFRKHKEERRRQQTELNHSSWRAAYEAANAAGRTAVNSLLLASGGAVVALLAFLGNLLSKDTSHDYLAQTRIALVVRGVANVLRPFAFSMVFAVLATAFIYVAMLSYAGAAREMGLDSAKAAKYDRMGGIFNWSAIVTGASSLILVIYGACIGMDMLSGV